MPAAAVQIMYGWPIMLDMIRRSVSPIAQRVRLMVGRARLAAVTDGGKRQFIQFTALADEVKDGVEHMQPFGFASHPTPGAQVLFICVGGDRGHPIAVCVDDPRSRIPLEAGEVAIYTGNGNKIVMKPSGDVEITTKTLTIKASDKIRCETDSFEVTGDITDRCDSVGRSMNAMRSIYDTHTHPETNTPGGDTQQPNQGMS